MDFKEWYLESTRTPFKVGLYPDLYDFVGQYPPLYGMPIAADYLYYFTTYFGPEGPYSKDGIVWYKAMHGSNDPHKPPPF